MCAVGRCRSTGSGFNDLHKSVITRIHMNRNMIWYSMFWLWIRSRKKRKQLFVPQGLSRKPLMNIHIFTAPSGSRTRVSSLEGSYPNRWTNGAHVPQRARGLNKLRVYFRVRLEPARFRASSAIDCEDFALKIYKIYWRTLTLTLRIFSLRLTVFKLPN